MRSGPATLCYSGLKTGMTQAVMNEIADRLENLSSTGETSAIDLRSLPLTDADLGELEELLGRGEVRAELDVLGKTRVWETAYAGVWWVRHLGGGEKTACEEIAITQLPGILFTHPEDIRAASERLRAERASAGPGDTELEASNG